MGLMILTLAGEAAADIGDTAYTYGVATVSRIDKIIGLLYRVLSLL